MSNQEVQDMKQQIHQLQLRDAVARQENAKLKRQLVVLKETYQQKESELQKLIKAQQIDEKLLRRHEQAVQKAKQVLQQKTNPLELQALQTQKQSLQEQLQSLQEQLQKELELQQMENNVIAQAANEEGNLIPTLQSQLELYETRLKEKLSELDKTKEQYEKEEHALSEEVKMWTQILNEKKETWREEQRQILKLQQDLGMSHTSKPSTSTVDKNAV